MLALQYFNIFAIFAFRISSQFGRNNRCRVNLSDFDLFLSKIVTIHFIQSKFDTWYKRVGYAG